MVVIVGETFSEPLEISIAREGSTLADQIRPPTRTDMATIKPLKNIGSLLSNFAPIIETIKIVSDKIAERIQKKQYALILKNIILINKMLKVEEAQEIRNINHHTNLFIFSLGEIKFSDINNVRINIVRYVINPAKERGILI